LEHWRSKITILITFVIHTYNSCHCHSILIQLISLLAGRCSPLLILQNVDGSTSFYRSWESFKAGFGSTTCNYWLGNELLHQLTKDGQYKVRLDLQATGSGQWYWAEYSTFIVDTEATKYKLTVDGYTGNANDAMNYHNGNTFTTFDSDNDHDHHGNCAVLRGGGFWYYNCARAHLTSAKGYHGLYDGPGWHHLPESNKHLQMIRVWLMCR